MDHGFCVVQAPSPTHIKHVPITTHKTNVDNNNMPYNAQIPSTYGSQN